MPYETRHYMGRLWQYPLQGHSTKNILQITVMLIVTAKNPNELQGFTSSWMFGGPWDSNLNMMGVPSLKLGVPSFYISFEFWKVVHPSVKAQCNCVVPRSVILRAMFGPLTIFFWGGGHLKFLRATYYHQWNTILYAFFYKSWTCP